MIIHELTPEEREKQDRKAEAEIYWSEIYAPGMKLIVDNSNKEYNRVDQIDRIRGALWAFNVKGKEYYVVPILAIAGFCISLVGFALTIYLISKS